MPTPVYGKTVSEYDLESTHLSLGHDDLCCRDIIPVHIVIVPRKSDRAEVQPGG